MESVARGRGTRVGRKVAASTTGCWSCGTARRSRALRKEKVGLCRQLMTSPPLELTNTPTADNTRGTTAHSLLPGGKRREIGVRSGIKRPIVDLTQWDVARKYIPNGRFTFFSPRRKLFHRQN